MDDRTRYETVKSRLRAMGEGTAQQVHDAVDDAPSKPLGPIVLANGDSGSNYRSLRGRR
jgi:hypothetical protein